MGVLAKTGFIVAFAVFSLSAAAQEIAGVSDHPLIGRYEGSIITFHQIKAYEEALLPRAPIERADADRLATKSAAVAGRLTEIRYEGPTGRSALEVVRNYQQALEGKGYETLFSCRRETCGYASGFWDAARGGIGLPTAWNDNTYALLRLSRPEGAVWVSVFAVGVEARGDDPLTPHLALRIMEEQPIETGKVEVLDAKTLAEQISLEGRVALYGITFDHDSAAITASSQAQIAEIAAYLKASPDTNVLVVGHTDMTGGLDYNRTLSERRASAVVEALVQDHAVAAGRLHAVGVGPAAPVASNRTEQGRAKNRRVEIVERISGE